LAIAAGAAGMVGGQADDLAGERGTEGIKFLESLHARKTGALFRASLRLGVLSARGERPEPQLLQIMENYGRCFGLAFQITDDLLDVEGSAEQTGKRVRKDAGRGKLTYPGLLGVAESRRRAERLCQEAEQHAAPLQPDSRWLTALARSILERNR
jgi:geranylgeranyl diphosphate synthase type II